MHKFNPLIKIGFDLLSEGEESEKMNTNGDNYVEDSPLVVPSISHVWKVNKQDGTTQVSTSTSVALVVENGAKVDFTGSFSWTAAAGKKSPTSITGDFGTVLPDSGVGVALSIQGITAARTISGTISAAKGGLIVENSKVVKASGTDSEKASVSVSFRHKLFYGTSTETAANVEELTGVLAASRAQTRKFNCTGGKYFYFAIPSALCSGIKFTIGGLTNSDFIITNVDIVNQYGYMVNYNVYRINSIQNGSAISVTVS